ncbi:MAG: protein translocase subunit SecD [Phycisphaerae bacterium]
MNDRQIWTKILIASVVTGLGVYASWPIDEKLKFGIDLQGGYSLLYEIDDTGMDAAQKAGLSEQVMKVLQERVDPDGVMNLVWRPVGSNRLEIQMPRPSEALLRGRQAYDGLRNELRDSNIKRSEVLIAINRPAAERTAALEALARGSARRKQLLAELAAIQDALVAAKAANNVDALNDNEDKLDHKLEDVLATNVDLAKLQAILEAKPKSKFRADELKKLTDALPERGDMLQKVVAAYDEWRQKRGRGGTLDDPADLERLLRGAGVLEFRILAETDPAEPTRFDTYRANLQKYGPRPRAGEETFAWFEIEKPRDYFKSPDIDKTFEQRKRSERQVVERYADKYYVLSYITANKALTHRPGETSWSLRSSNPTRDDKGRPAVAFELDERGGIRFEALTRLNKDKLLCIFLDDRAVSAATINAVIRTRGIIEGNFTVTEVQELVKKLNAGSLPRKLKEPPISVRAVGPSLGAANRESGLRSSQYAAVAVAAFMLIYYFYAGAIAVIAVGLNVLLTLAVLGFMGATWTLAGVAGLVLSIGMAVDANILINERIREEQDRGIPLRTAIRLGYERALSAIIDSNLTTFITSVILYWIASEEIKGFGLTLAAGVVINIFTAVSLTRVFFEFMTLPRVTAELVKDFFVCAAAPLAVGALLLFAGRALIAPDNQPGALSLAFAQLLLYVGGSVAALFVLMWIGRVIHSVAGSSGGSRLPMLRLIGVPKIDWYAKRHLFYFMSGVLAVGGLALFATRDPKQLYDIEFLGGTTASIDLKNPGSLSEADIRARMGRAADELAQFADAIGQRADISAKGNEFVLGVPGVPAGRMRDFLQAVLGDWLAPNGMRETGAEQLTLATKGDVQIGADGVSDAKAEPTRLGLRGGLARVASQLRRWSGDLREAQIQEVKSVEGASAAGGSWDIISRVTSKDVVVSAILSAMGSDVDVAPSLAFDIRKNERLAGAEFFPITDADLAKVTGDASIIADASEHRGGVALVLSGLNPPQTAEALGKRIAAMRLQPGFERTGWRDSAVVGLKKASSGDGFTDVAVMVSDENFVYDETAESSEAWRANLAEPESRLVRAALERQTSLGKIVQFAPQVASEAKNKAYIALGLSWIAIIIYVWFRFGSMTWGAAAVIALIHDVFVALGFVAVSQFLAGTAIGQALHIEHFRVDLAMVAALLTVVGYSVNDTIIVFDRMRENRGKAEELRPSLINNSINQTLSRTLLTVLTVLVTAFIMYWYGGAGVHGFMYAMLIGTLSGSYSSVYVASPLLLALARRMKPTADRTARRPAMAGA